MQELSAEGQITTRGTIEVLRFGGWLSNRYVEVRSHDGTLQRLRPGDTYLLTATVDIKGP